MQLELLEENLNTGKKTRLSIDPDNEGARLLYNLDAQLLYVSSHPWLYHVGSEWDIAHFRYHIVKVSGPVFKANRLYSGGVHIRIREVITCTRVFGLFRYFKYVFSYPESPDQTQYTATQNELLRMLACLE